MNSNEKYKEIREKQKGLAEDSLRKGQIMQTSEYKVLFGVVNFTKFVLDFEDNLRGHDSLDRDDLISILSDTFLTHTDELISIIDNTVYYHDKNTLHWIPLEASDKNSFKQFVKNILNLAYNKITICKQASDHVIAGLTSSSQANNIIQFEDCYIENNDLHFGVSDTIRPKYRIQLDIYSYLENQEDIYSKEVEDLLMHICNNEEDTYERLLDDLAMIFVTDSNLVSHLGRFVRIYGPLGSNGKSTLMNLIRESVGESNIGSFKTHNFHTYQPADAIDYLMVFDDDEQSQRIPDSASTNIKSFVTSGKVIVRQIREKSRALHPTVSLMSLSNTLPKSEDKTEGFGRRLDWFYVSDKLVRTDKWFELLFSEKSRKYLVQKLVKRALNFMRKDRTELSKLSESMKAMSNEFKKNNSSAIDFADEYGREWFVNRTFKKAFNEYEIYCNDNLLSTIGYNNFIRAIIEQFGLAKMKISLSKSKDANDFRLFKDSLNDSTKEQLLDTVGGGQITYLNAINEFSDINDPDLKERAQKEADRSGKMSFVEHQK